MANAGSVRLYDANKLSAFTYSGRWVVTVEAFDDPVGSDGDVSAFFFAVATPGGKLVFEIYRSYSATTPDLGDGFIFDSADPPVWADYWDHWTEAIPPGNASIRDGSHFDFDLTWAVTLDPASDPDWDQPPPVPVNDNIADAIELTGTEGSIAGTTAGATREAVEDEPTASNPYGDSSVWYKITPASDIRLRFDTLLTTPAMWSSFIDTTVGVYYYFGGDFYELKFQDDAEEDVGRFYYLTALDVLLSVGYTFYIRVAGQWEGEEGDFVLSWGPAPALPGDNFADAIEIPNIYAGGSSGTITTPDLTECTREPGEPNHSYFGATSTPSSYTAWYKWTCPSGPSWDPKRGQIMYLYKGGSGVSAGGIYYDEQFALVGAVYEGDSLETLRPIGYTDSYDHLPDGTLSYGNYLMAIGRPGVTYYFVLVLSTLDQYTFTWYVEDLLAWKWEGPRDVMLMGDEAFESGFMGLDRGGYREALYWGDNQRQVSLQPLGAERFEGDEYFNKGAIVNGKLMVPWIDYDREDYRTHSEPYLFTSKVQTAGTGVSAVLDFSPAALGIEKGDFLIVFCEYGSGENIFYPGWTGGSITTVGTRRFLMLVKTAGDAEADMSIYRTFQTTLAKGVLLVYRNVRKEITAALVSNTSGTAITAPGIAQWDDDYFMITIWAADTNITITPPGGITPDLVSQGTASEPAIVVGHKLAPENVPAGNQVATASASTIGQGWTFFLEGPITESRRKQEIWYYEDGLYRPPNMDWGKDALDELELIVMNSEFTPNRMEIFEIIWRFGYIWLVCQEVLAKFSENGVLLDYWIDPIDNGFFSGAGEIAPTPDGKFAILTTSPYSVRIFDPDTGVITNTGIYHSDATHALSQILPIFSDGHCWTIGRGLSTQAGYVSGSLHFMLWDDDWRTTDASIGSYATLLYQISLTTIIAAQGATPGVDTWLLVGTACQRPGDDYSIYFTRFHMPYALHQTNVPAGKFYDIGGNWFSCRLYRLDADRYDIFNILRTNDSQFTDLNIDNWKHVGGTTRKEDLSIVGVPASHSGVGGGTRTMRYNGSGGTGTFPLTLRDQAFGLPHIEVNPGDLCIFEVWAQVGGFVPNTTTCRLRLNYTYYDSTGTVLYDTGAVADDAYNAKTFVEADGWVLLSTQAMLVHAPAGTAYMGVRIDKLSGPANGNYYFSDIHTSRLGATAAVFPRGWWDTWPRWTTIQGGGPDWFIGNWCTPMLDSGGKNNRNMFEPDDANFINSLGHWQPFFEFSAELVDSPAPPSGIGHAVKIVTIEGSAGWALTLGYEGPPLSYVDTRLTARYSAVPGQEVTFSCKVRADPANSGPMQAWIGLSTHDDNYHGVTSGYSEDGDGTPISDSDWTEISVTFTLDEGGSGGWWPFFIIEFEPLGNPNGHPARGDVFYVADFFYDGGFEEGRVIWDGVPTDLLAEDDANFVSSLGGWKVDTTFYSPNLVLSRSPVPAPHGGVGQSMVMTCTDTASHLAAVLNNDGTIADRISRYPVIPGKFYRMTAAVENLQRISGQTFRAGIEIDFYDDAGAPVDSVVIENKTWWDDWRVMRTDYITGSLLAPPTAAYAVLWVLMFPLSGTLEAGDEMYVSDIHFEVVDFNPVSGPLEYVGKPAGMRSGPRGVA